MKQKDIATLIIIVIISGLLSFFVSKLLFSSVKTGETKAEYVDAISTTFITPSEKYFNASAINPTQPIRIGDGSNVTPFAGER